MMAHLGFRLFQLSVAAPSWVAAWDPVGDGSCSSVSDCFGFGDCVEGQCRCDAHADAAPNCDVFSLQPVDLATAGYRNDSAPTWGGNFLTDEDGVVHGFAGSMTPGYAGRYTDFRFPQTTHITARSLSGPWDVHSVLEGGSEAQIRRVPEVAGGGYVLFTDGYGAAGSGLRATWAKELRDFGLPGATSDIDFVFRLETVDPARPWICHMKGWGAEILPDGSAMVSFVAGGHKCEENSYVGWPAERLGLARADCWNCSYRIITEKPLFQGQPGGDSNEDGFLWWSHRGLHLVMHSQDMSDEPELWRERRGVVAFSPDVERFSPESWVISPNPAYGPWVPLENGTTAMALRRQRPSIVWEEDGDVGEITGWPHRTPTHLSNNVDFEYGKNSDGWGNSWTLLTPLARAEASSPSVLV